MPLNRFPSPFHQLNQEGVSLRTVGDWLNQYVSRDELNRAHHAYARGEKPSKGVITRDWCVLDRSGYDEFRQMDRLLPEQLRYYSVAEFEVKLFFDKAFRLSYLGWEYPAQREDRSLNRRGWSDGGVVDLIPSPSMPPRDPYELLPPVSGNPVLRVVPKEWRGPKGTVNHKRVNRLLALEQTAYLLVLADTGHVFWVHRRSGHSDRMGILYCKPAADTPYGSLVPYQLQHKFPNLPVHTVYANALGEHYYLQRSGYTPTDGVLVAAMEAIGQPQLLPDVYARELARMDRLAAYVESLSAQAQQSARELKTSISIARQSPPFHGN